MAIIVQLFIFAIFARAANAIAGESLGRRPCTELEGTEDESFLKKNLLHLHSDPIAFFEHEVPKECNLQFIDISKIEPPRSYDYTWIMYLGDSVAYDLYAAAVQRLTGYNPAANATEIPLTKLGKHLGPQEDIRHEELIRSVRTAPEYLVCCRARYHPQGSGNSDGSDSCVMGVNSRSALWNKNLLKKYKFYLFDDASEYIRDVIELLFMGNFKCISFLWSADFYEAAMQINNLNKADRYPRAVIMNMGVHTYTKEHKELDKHLKAIIKSTDQTPLEHETRYILHSCSSLRFHKNGTNDRVHLFNEHIKSFVPKWSSLNLYLDFWEYDVALSSVEGCKRQDGIHFERICNYQPMITQWDFNWLLYLKVISLEDDDLFAASSRHRL